MLRTSSTSARLPEIPVATPSLREPRREQLVRAGAALWRVTDAHGRVLGHLRAVADRFGQRYRAERYQPMSASFRELGSFWNVDEAVRTLRYLR